MGFPYFESFVMPIPGDWVQWAIEIDESYVAAGIWDYQTPTPIQEASYGVGSGTYNLKVFTYWDDGLLTYTVNCPTPTLEPTPPPTVELLTPTPTVELPTPTPTVELLTPIPTVELPTPTPTVEPTEATDEAP